MNKLIQDYKDWLRSPQRPEPNYQQEKEIIISKAFISLILRTRRECIQRHLFRSKLYQLLFLTESTFTLLSFLYQPSVFNNQFRRAEIGTNWSWPQFCKENWKILFQSFQLFKMVKNGSWLNTHTRMHIFTYVFRTKFNISVRSLTFWFRVLIHRLYTKICSTRTRLVFQRCNVSRVVRARFFDVKSKFPAEYEPR